MSTFTEAPQITSFGDKDGKKHIVKKSTESFTFHCRVHGHPRPRRYYARVDKTPMPADAIDDNNGTLTIPRLRYPEDSGEYMCVANNTWGEDRSTAKLEVIRKTLTVVLDSTSSCPCISPTIALYFHSKMQLSKEH